MPLPTLEIAALVVPALFLADPVVRQTLRPFESAASLPAVERKPPIVLVIFDELPLNSLLAADGTIDAGRYPNFATFAHDAYWFRNTSTVASNTSHAVPAILSGRYPTTVNDVPTIEYYPVNLFTALAPHYEISASFRFRTLCPRRACLEAGVADTVGSLLADLGVVWLHIVLPDTLANTLPPAGLLDTSRGEPVAVAVLVNGVVAAVTHSYRERGAHRFGTLIPESSLRNGRNVVAGVALDEPPAR